MAWIDTIAPDAATGPLGDLYAAIAKSRGGVAEIHAAQSLNPRALKAHLELYKAVVLAGSHLSRLTRERIAVVVSTANSCHYCMEHHSEALLHLGESPTVVDALKRGDIPSRLDANEQRLLQWCQDGAVRPATCAQETVEQLRQAGYDDRAILDASLTVAYFNFVNRLVLMLGVDLEASYRHLCKDRNDREANDSPGEDTDRSNTIPFKRAAG